MTRKATTAEKLNCIRIRIEDVQNWMIENESAEYPQSFCSFTLDELHKMYYEVQTNVFQY